MECSSEIWYIFHTFERFRSPLFSSPDRLSGVFDQVVLPVFIHMHDNVVSGLGCLFNALGKPFMFRTILFQKIYDIFILRFMFLIFFFDVVVFINYIWVKPKNHRMVFFCQRNQMIQHERYEFCIMPVHNRATRDIHHRFSKQNRTNQNKRTGHDLTVF